MAEEPTVAEKVHSGVCPCGRQAEQIGYRIQPVILGGELMTVRGVFCEHCAADIANGENWVRRGNGPWELVIDG